MATDRAEERYEGPSAHAGRKLNLGNTLREDELIVALLAACCTAFNVVIIPRPTSSWYDSRYEHYQGRLLHEMIGRQNRCENARLGKR